VDRCAGNTPGTLPFFCADRVDHPGDPRSNLCLKAYQLLKSAHELPPVQIHLHKIIPTGAGLGGGSSDGAHTLRLLNRKFNLRLSDTALLSYAAQLGSDCPFFIQDEPMLGSGRGEVLQSCLINLKGYYLVLVKPDIHVSTADAYSRVRPNIPDKPLETLLRLPIPEWRYQVKNDFESSVFEQYPKLKAVKSALYEQGALYASMSGSGSAIFGIFEKEMIPPEGVMDGMCWSG